MSPREIIDEPNSFITSSVTPEALRRFVSQHAGPLVAGADEAHIAVDLMLKAADEIDRLRDALFWCSGSPSFAPDGEAHEGWKKVVGPLMRPSE